MVANILFDDKDHLVESMLISPLKSNYFPTLQTVYKIHIGCVANSSQ